MDDTNEFHDLFADDSADDAVPEISSDAINYWKILVVDDDEDIHIVTRLALQDLCFQGRKLVIFGARSGAEARNFLIKHPDIALILLDVVMEEDLAGLNLVRYIRNDLKNHTIRIVLRTGQPGVAPERDVINQYEIDDYKSKTELTSEKLITVITVGLRTYEAMLTKDRYQEKLEQEVTRRTAALQQALDEIKMLQGIIPICSHCKKIRDDAGCWNRFEAYIQKHSEARFSHGICPDCARQFYPGFDLPDDS